MSTEDNDKRKRNIKLKKKSTNRRKKQIIYRNRD